MGSAGYDVREGSQGSFDTVSYTMTMPQTSVSGLDLAPLAQNAVSRHLPSSWSGGLQGQVTVTGAGTSPVHGWAIGWTFPGSQEITDLRNGIYRQNGQAVTATNEPHNGTLQPGVSITAGFNAAYTDSNTSPSSVTCT